MSCAQDSVPDVETVVRKLLAYCRANDWAGYDPYDALNSKLFQALPVLDTRVPRLVLTQLLKRSPVNFRPLLSIPPTQNPKALALFLSGVLKVPELNKGETVSTVRELFDLLVALRSKDSPYWCWGYSFPWQTRTLIVPRGTPNLVCTTFVANALLDVFEWSGEERYLEMAASSANYLAKELYWADSQGRAGFVYPLPSMRQSIHNANFLGAALLCRVAKHAGQSKLIEPALRAARYSASRQREDGSWAYGEMPTQAWVDNFHTGYNLCGLRSIALDVETAEFDVAIRRGYEFYSDHFLRSDGAPRYFHNHTYPIDIHCAAQSILTFLTFRDLDSHGLAKARSVFSWTTDNMWDDRGYFFYRVLRFHKIRTSYMRWSQAWMLLAAATLLEGPVVGIGDSRRDAVSQ